MVEHAAVCIEVLQKWISFDITYLILEVYLDEVTAKYLEVCA